MSNNNDIQEYDWGREKPSSETYIVLPVQNTTTSDDVGPQVESKRYGTNKPKREVIIASIAHNSDD